MAKKKSVPKKAVAKKSNKKLHAPTQEQVDPFAIELLSDEELVKRGLALARMFYLAHGYEVEEGFKFYASRHPQELGMWRLAGIAFSELTGTDLDESLDNVLADSDEE